MEKTDVGDEERGKDWRFQRRIMEGKDKREAMCVSYFVIWLQKGVKSNSLTDKEREKQTGK